MFSAQKVLLLYLIKSDRPVWSFVKRKHISELASIKQHCAFSRCAVLPVSWHMLKIFVTCSHVLFNSDSSNGEMFKAHYKHERISGYMLHLRRIDTNALK